MFPNIAFPTFKLLNAPISAACVIYIYKPINKRILELHQNYRKTQKTEALTDDDLNWWEQIKLTCPTSIT